MPTYKYICNTCKEIWKSFHGIEETEKICNFCSSSDIEKSFTSIMQNIKINTQKSQQCGDRVEKYIEEARQSLKEQIKEARKEYKP